jgi:hypothetical protein
MEILGSRFPELMLKAKKNKAEECAGLNSIFISKLQ